MTVAETTTHEAREVDIRAIRDVVASIELAQRRERVDEFINLFREDAIWTTGGGKVLVGRDAIGAFTRQVLPGAMTDLSVTFEVVHVLFIRSDVAAVKVRQTYSRRNGQPLDSEAEGSPLFVVVKDDGNWWLVACQNTPVVGS